MNTGILVHPAVKDLVYARHDVSGMFRWNPQTQAWTQLLDWLPFSNGRVKGCDGFAVDTMAGNDKARQDVIYAALGQGPNYLVTAQAGNGVFRSTDRGDTWTKIWDGAVVSIGPMKIWSYAANAAARGTGEPLAVDPFNPNVLWAGTRNNGLYRAFNARDAKPVFERCDGAPVGFVQNATHPRGIRIVWPDPRGGTMETGTPRERAKRIYLGVPQGGSGADAFEGGVWRSDDGGANWTRLGGENAPVYPVGIAPGPNGSIFTGNGGRKGGYGAGLRVWDGAKWNIVEGTEKENFTDVASNPADLGQGVAVGEYGLFVSQNGIWSRRDRGVLSVEKANWQQPTFFYPLTGAANYAFDPFRPGAIWEGDPYGISFSSDVFAAKPRFAPRLKNLETTVNWSLCAPPSGNGNNVVLWSTCADVNGFAHRNLDEFPQEQLWQTLGMKVYGGIGSAAFSDIEYCPAQPQFMAASQSTKSGYADPMAQIHLSQDGGKTWKAFPAPPLRADAAPGTSTASGAAKLAFSSQNPNLLLFWGSNRKPYFTRNALAPDGPAWTESRGLDWSMTNIYPYNTTTLLLAADPKDGETFYLSHRYSAYGGAQSRVWVSHDGGANWQLPEGQNGVPLFGNYTRLTAVVNAAGQSEVWVNGPPDAPLCHSLDGGKTWQKVSPLIASIEMFAFGKAAPGHTNAALFVLGTVMLDGKARSGAFISDDLGQSFRPMTDAQLPMIGGSSLSQAEGDPNVYGRLFVSVDGSGILYSERQN